MIEDDDPFAVENTKFHDAYTNPEKTTSFGSPINLARPTDCTLKHVNRYLNSSEAYTKFKLTRKRFPRIKVISFRLNEVWSIDLADMQKLPEKNLAVRYLFVAVDTLSHFLWVVGVKSKTSKACSEALKKLFQLISNEMPHKLVQPKKFPKRYGLIKVKSLLVNSQNFAKRIV